MLTTLLSVFCILLPTIPDEQPTVQYFVSIPQPQTHIFHVEMHIDDWKGGDMDLSMPVWTPGSYLVREYSRHVYQFDAGDGTGASLEWEKTDKNTWRVHAGDATSVVIKTEIYGRENSIRWSYVNAEHGHILGVSLFFYLKGMLDAPSTLTLHLPENWKVSNGLIPVAGDPFTFKLTDYHELVDSPMLIGQHREDTFEVDGIPHVVASVGRTDADIDAYVEKVKKIVEAGSEMFGGLPYKKYAFIVRFGGGGGGLEHANGTTMGLGRWGLKGEKGEYRLLGLTSHEYFHAWNVKRIQTPVFKPYDYDVENYTGMLWFHEGVTSYYTSKQLLRANLVKPEKAVEEMAGGITNYTNSAGMKYQSPTESSFDAWIKGYRYDEFMDNINVSYYLTGSLIGLALDLEILHRTEGKHSLDDVLRIMWERTRDKGIGFTTDDVQSICEEVGGGTFSEFFDRHVRGREQIRFGDFLSYAGYNLEVDEEKTKDHTKGGYLGANLRKIDGSVRIEHVVIDGPAWRDGLNYDDEIIAVDGVRINEPDDVDRIIEATESGKKLAFLISRSGLIEEIYVTLGEFMDKVWKITEIVDATEEHLAIRKQWLIIGNE